MIMTFNDITSKDMDVIIGKVNRPLMPELTKNTIKICGRHGEIDLEDNTYNNKIIEVEIAYKAKTKSERMIKAREVAAWLSKKTKTKLSFSDDPSVHYIGRVYSNIPLETFVTVGQATIVFDCEPFAYSERKTAQQTITMNLQEIEVENKGAISTPFRIKLKNIGNSTINQITLVKIK